MVMQTVRRPGLQAPSARRAKAKPRAKREGGHREANKAEKRERIKVAARMLFSKGGYEDTTVRQIAHKAGVALGTLSLYAKDKRDLILLMINDDIADMIDTARASSRDDAGFLDNLIAYFRVFYTEFASNLNLARTFLQLNFFSDGMNTAGLNENREKMLAGIQDLVELAKAQGRLDPDVASSEIAQLVFLAYVGAVRWWVAEEKPDVRKGLTHLRNLLRLQANGFRSRNAAGSLQSADVKSKTGTSCQLSR